MLSDLYNIGKQLPLELSNKDYDKKLKFIQYPYTFSDIALTSAVVFVAALVLGLVFSFISGFFTTTFIFLGFVGAVVLYIFPRYVHYTHEIMLYREEMLRSILHLSTYIQTGSSMEYAFKHTEEAISGILQRQFRDINNQITRKIKPTLGDAIKTYSDDWKETNPEYVKSIRLLQLASLSGEEDKDRLIKETLESLTMNYMSLGKRSGEELAKKTNMLIGGGLLLPILSLLGLPILAVFMPQIVKESIIAFIYIILFPTIVFITSLSFASKRVQVDTIKLQDAEKFKPFPTKYFYISLAIAIAGIIPTIIGVQYVVANTTVESNTFLHVILGWTASAGIAAAFYLYAYVHTKKYEKLWQSIADVETDLPFMLQSFSTYFTLNTPMEKVLDGVIDDYENLGFKKHPVVLAFKELKRKLLTTKSTIHELIRKHLKHVIPSGKVRSILGQIVSYEAVSQKSAAKASKLVREQVINTYKLDDYIKTLLAETVGLIKSSINMLAPLLASVAVVMTFAILKSTVYIAQQLANISSAFGGQALDLQLVDVSTVISPIFIEAVVGIYLVLMMIILSIFQTQVSAGSDRFLFMKTVKSNITSFLLYTILLFGGYYFVNILLFQSLVV